MKSILHSVITLLALRITIAAPTNDRQGKNLAYIDYLQPEVDYNNFGVENDDYISMALEENDLSRTIPSRKAIRPQHYNSPIYYIRLPPQPYMFVPGLGYVSQPSPSPVQQFVNLPVSFIANGKPSSIYQWSGAIQGFPTQVPPTSSFSVPGFQSVPAAAQPLGVPKPPKPVKKPVHSDSTIHRVPGTFTFNGKPEDVFVLRDSYNSLYNDVLQNVYP